MFSTLSPPNRFATEADSPRKPVTQSDRIRSAVYLLNGISRFTIGAVVCIAPWCLGGVEPSAQVFLYAGVLASLLIWCVSATLSHSTMGLVPIRLPLLMLPLLGGLLLATYQMAAPPGTSTSRNSDSSKAKTVASEVAAADSAAWSDASGPEKASEWSRAAASPNSSEALLRRLIPGDYSLRTISIALTRSESVRLGMAIIVLFLGVVLFQSQASHLWLWSTLAINGAVLSLFGLIQNLSWNGHLFWSIPLTFGGQPFASFVNHNNAAGYLNITLATALGVTCCALNRKDWFDYCHKVIFDGHGSQSRRWTRILVTNTRLILGRLDKFQWSTGVVVLAILIGIIGSQSRSGLMASGVATVTSLFLLVRLRNEQRSRIATGVEISLFMVGLVVWTGLVGTATGCWGDSDRQSEVHSNWHDALKVVDEFPVTGAGMGSYRYAYLPYQSRQANTWFVHADNQYVELLVETGLVGVGLSVVFLLAGLGSSLALSRNRHRPSDDPAGVVGAFALISQAICACFDFGPTLPAAMLTLALILGAVTGRCARLADYDDAQIWWLACPGLRPAWMIILIGVGFLIHGSIGWTDVCASAAARSSGRGIPQKLNAPDSMTLKQVNDAIRRLTDASHRQPDSAEIHRQLGELWVYRYRLVSFAALVEQRGHGDDASLWARTNVAALYAAANESVAKGQFTQLEELRASTWISENLFPARRHFLQAQHLSPALPGLDLPLAALEFIDVDGRVDGLHRLERAIALTPKDSGVLGTTAALAEVAGLDELAHSCWRRELLLNPEALLTIARHLAGRMDIHDQMARVLPDSPASLFEVATSVYSGDEQPRRILLTRALDLFEKGDSAFATSADLHRMGRARHLLGEPDSAIDYYRRALATEPLQLPWRLELVDLLRSRGQTSRALKQAELCLTLDPTRKQTKELINQLRAEAASSLQLQENELRIRPD